MPKKIVPRRTPSRKNRYGVVFCEGDVVKLSPNAFKTRDDQPVTFLGRPVAKARIAGFYKEVRGLARLEHRLGGYTTWSVDDLVHVKQRKAGQHG